jgi:(4S)-4-hydroxy-5-phosphonooxypentane-2,3-dione isomerase
MTYVIAVKWIARPGEEDEVARCARALIEPTRREPGHLESAHVQALGFGDAFPRLEARERTVYLPIDP